MFLHRLDLSHGWFRLDPLPRYTPVDWHDGRGCEHGSFSSRGGMAVTVRFYSIQMSLLSDSSLATHHVGLRYAVVLWDGAVGWI